MTKLEKFIDVAVQNLDVNGVKWGDQIDAVVIDCPKDVDYGIRIGDMIRVELTGALIMKDRGDNNYNLAIDVNDIIGVYRGGVLKDIPKICHFIDVKVSNLNLNEGPTIVEAVVIYVPENRICKYKVGDKVRVDASKALVRKDRGDGKYMLTVDIRDIIDTL